MLEREAKVTNAREIDLEIRRKCIAIGLNCDDEFALQILAREVLWDMTSLNKAASAGNIPARIKVELYALTMMVHRINTDTSVSGYMIQFDDVFSLKSSWSAIARAIWKELDSRGSYDSSDDEDD